MTAAIEKDEAMVLPPFVRNSGADNTGEYGVFREAATTTAQSDDVPTAWKGAYVTLCARGTYVQYAIVLKGDVAPTIVIDQAGGFGAQNKNAAITILEDHKESVWIPNNADKIVWICGSANAGEFFEGHLSGPKRGR